jgi:hypothetical protein
MANILQTKSECLEENSSEMDVDEEDFDRRSWAVLKRILVYILLIIFTPVSLCVLGKVYIFESKLFCLFIY